MNKKLGLAVAGALLALSSTANAGITIPAGDWTLDIGGVVNAYYTTTRNSGESTIGYGRFWGGRDNGDALSGNESASGSQSNITTGLLPNYLSVSGKSRQNDLDIGFTISINPGASTRQAGIQSAQQENRQAFLTIGDASWGSVKLGKDLGIFASDAILNDMTLLGVGSGAGGLAGNTTTTGRIGTGFMYADWKAQAAYTTPNWSGFQATVGVTQAFNSQSINAFDALGAAAPRSTAADATSQGRGGNQPGYEAKASYAWTGDVAGKVWVSALSQKLQDLGSFGDETARALDVGANVNVGGLGLTGYYYDGKGIGQTVQFFGGVDAYGKRRDSKGGYVQATYVIPTGTKLGASWGQSKLEANSRDNLLGDLTDEMWVVGAYHPITKSVNLVAEYSAVKSEYENGRAAGRDSEGKGKTLSLGAILFF
jgi:predicted porin